MVIVFHLVKQSTKPLLLLTWDPYNGSENFKTLLLPQLQLFFKQTFPKYFLVVLTKVTPWHFEILNLKSLKNIEIFFIDWDPMGVKISKRLIHLLQLLFFSIKLFQNVPSQSSQKLLIGILKIKIYLKKKTLKITLSPMKK